MQAAQPQNPHRRSQDAQEKASRRKSTQEDLCPPTPSIATKGLHFVLTGLSLPSQTLSLRVQFTPPKLTSGSPNKHLLHKCLREEKDEWTIAESKCVHFHGEVTMPKHLERSGVQSWGRQELLNTLPGIISKRAENYGKCYHFHFTGEEMSWESWLKPPAPLILTTLFSALLLPSKMLSSPSSQWKNSLGKSN